VIRATDAGSADAPECVSVEDCALLPGSAALCANGACAHACLPGYADCDAIGENGCEASLDSTTSCGACGVTCDFPGGDVECVAGECKVRECYTGFGDCDGNRSTPCTALPLRWPDRDLDGQGDGLVAGTYGCPGVGWVDNAHDCDDDDDRALRGQTAWLSEPRANGTFDFDCDGLETMERPAAFRCTRDESCRLTQGWRAPIPPCGEEGHWVRFCDDYCVRDGGGRRAIQRCR
jgi:hypothetical protein